MAVRTEKGLSRLIGFSDGVVAIAITLLVLPLVSSAADLTTDVGSFLSANLSQLLTMAISFVVIGRFWLAHHSMYENVAAYSPALLAANLFWLFTIVFLPFPTELLAGADTDDRIKYALYVGTMTLTSLASLLQQVILSRNPVLQADEANGNFPVMPYVSTTTLLLASLVLATAFPTIGLWSLLLLTLASPLEKLFERGPFKRTRALRG